MKGSEEYAKNIVNKINPEDVDSISGATYSYNQFTDAVFDALDKAAE
ncbi:MAG: FMN-binding protein [Ruminococcus sp.]|nr:FMN-binding protein [Ruminococcus sp.]